MANNDSTANFTYEQLSNINDDEYHAFNECISLTLGCYEKIDACYYAKFLETLLNIKKICIEVLSKNKMHSMEVYAVFQTGDFAHLIQLGLTQLKIAGYPSCTVQFLDNIQILLNIMSSICSKIYKYQTEHKYFSSHHAKLSRFLEEINFYLALNKKSRV